MDIIEEYRKNPAINQSVLKALVYKPLNKIVEEESELYYEEKTHFIIGGAVDCMLTQGIDEFNSKYYVSRLENKYSDKITSICKEVFDMASKNNEELVLTSLYPYILQACNNHEYLMNWKDDTRVNKIIEAGEYFNSLIESNNKTVLSQEEYTKVSNIVNSLLNNDTTKDYFIEGFEATILYQLPIYFKYKDVDCKALLDMVRIDHTNKIIYPIDIKTSGDYTRNFLKSIRRFSYHIQAAFYTEALEYYVSTKEELKGYKIANFRFIVESVIEQGEPSVYILSDDYLEIGKNGREEILLEKEINGSLVEYNRIPAIEGFSQLIDRYKWYMNHLDYEKRMEYFMKNGHFCVDYNGIINK